MQQQCGARAALVVVGVGAVLVVVGVGAVLVVVEVGAVLLVVGVGAVLVDNSLPQILCVMLNEQTNNNEYYSIVVYEYLINFIK